MTTTKTIPAKAAQNQALRGVVNVRRIARQCARVYQQLCEERRAVLVVCRHCGPAVSALVSFSAPVKFRTPYKGQAGARSRGEKNQPSCQFSSHAFRWPAPALATRPLSPATTTSCTLHAPRLLHCFSSSEKACFNDARRSSAPPPPSAARRAARMRSRSAFAAARPAERRAFSLARRSARTFRATRACAGGSRTATLT